MIFTLTQVVSARMARSFGFRFLNAERFGIKIF